MAANSIQHFFSTSSLTNQYHHFNAGIGCNFRVRPAWRPFLNTFLISFSLEDTYRILQSMIQEPKFGRHTRIGMSNKIKARPILNLALLTNKRSKTFSYKICMETTDYLSFVITVKNVLIFKILFWETFWAIRATKTWYWIYTITEKRFAYAMVYLKMKLVLTTRMGFEPTRAEHIGLAVQRLNHSATSSNIPLHKKKSYY